MLQIGKYKIFHGDFHGQWNAAEEELALLVAGLWYHGYDFTAFQSPARYDALQGIITENKLPIHVFSGKEYMYDWAHLTTVGVRGEAPPINAPDCEKILAWYKANSEWVVMAHPYEFMIDKLESLLDRNLLDAVELVNGFPNSNRNQKLLAWYDELLKRGKPVPIVSGLDIHTPGGSRRPSVLYGENYPPSSDISLFGANRTGVITENCDVKSIKSAIFAGKSFIELSDPRKLIGPPGIIEYLGGHQYWEKVDEDLKWRRKIVPQTAGMITGGSENELTYPVLADTVEISGTSHKIPSSGRVSINVPLRFSRNTQYLNIVSRSADALSVNALKVCHPIHVEIFPEIENGRCRTITNISNAGIEILTGLQLTISAGGVELSNKVPAMKRNAVEQLVHEWNIADPCRPSKFEIKVGDAKISKSFSKYLVFIECPYVGNPENHGEWEKIRPVRLSGNFSEQVDTDYTVEWHGDDDLSSEVKSAWNQKGLFFKMSFKDDILVPSKTALLMFGDCFQIGVNPVATEAVGNQSFYDIMMTRGAESDGVEKAYMERPVDMALEYPQNQRVLLDGLYNGKVIDGKFNALLFLPFHMIAPMQPVPGYRFGLYYVIFDNDGTGLKTALQWPLHAERYVKQAWYIPYGGAWASVKLTK
jgi:hypothetical protein